MQKGYLGSNMTLVVNLCFKLNFKLRLLVIPQLLKIFALTRRSAIKIDVEFSNHAQEAIQCGR